MQLSPVEACDILSYLVLETSFCTEDQFKTFRSLLTYYQMVSGFITSVLGHIIQDKFVVLAKVRHSQRMNDTHVRLWIIATKEGTAVSAHCAGCMAGLEECCSHIASVLFYLEVWTRSTRAVIRAILSRLSIGQWEDKRFDVMEIKPWHSFADGIFWRRKTKAGKIRLCSHASPFFSLFCYRVH